MDNACILNLSWFEEKISWQSKARVVVTVNCNSKRSEWAYDTLSDWEPKDLETEGNDLIIFELVFHIT